jgi:FkbM family methyltransferase
MVAAVAENVSLRRIKQAVRALLPQTVLNWREARYFQRYGEVEIHLVDLLCRTGEDAIDVGANYGGYVHFMQRHARRVVAFEPVPEFVRQLRTRFGDTVLIEPIALSDRAGEATLYIPVINGVNVGGCSSLSQSAATNYETHQAITARTLRLDDAYAGTVGFIKIDVEGHEQAVLDGAVATLRRCRPRLLVEIEERLAPGGIARTSAFITALGYRGYYIHAGELHGIEEFSVARHQSPELVPDMTAALRGRVKLGDFVCNFIFLPLDDEQQTARAIRERLASLRA